jgi:hypothetical protein
MKTWGGKIIYVSSHNCHPKDMRSDINVDRIEQV